MQRIITLSIRHLLFALLCLSAVTLFAQTNVNVVDIPGAVSVNITGINNSGDVTGYYCEQGQYCNQWTNIVRGFLRDSTGTITTFEGIPEAINDAGTVAGYVAASSGLLGFIRNKQGVVTTFDVAGWVGPVGPVVTAMNNREEVAGYFFPCDGCIHDAPHVFVRSKKGTITEYYVAFHMEPTGINARGDLIGFWISCCEQFGYLVERSGAVTDLRPTTDTGALHAHPVAINNSGDVAGYCGNNRGFLRDRDGTFTIFEGIPIAMNERGDIVGRDFIRDASSGTISTLNCPFDYTTHSIVMNDRGDVAGGNVICSIH